MKRIILLLPVIFVCSISMAQNDFNDFNRVIPPSPTTRAFIQNVSYNLDYYNGSVNVTIPLYTIHLKGLDLPISLQYNTTGIKRGQDNGEAGVGWVIVPGYRVARTIYGHADDRYPMPSYISDSLSYYTSMGSDIRDKFLAEFVGSEVSGVPLPYGGDRIDGEYDIFKYILPGESGSFIIKDRDNKVCQPLNGSNVRINYTTGQSVNEDMDGILNFDVKDENGNHYMFGEHAAADTNVFESASEDAVGLASAWALTHITTYAGDEADFSYVKMGEGGWNSSAQTTTINDGSDCDSDIRDRFSSTYGSYNPYTTFFLNEISTTNEKIEYVRQRGSKVISELDVYSAANKRIKTIQFFYNTTSTPYLFLDSLKITGSADNEATIYRFSYYDEDVNGNSLIADQWGYCMNGQIGDVYHIEFADDPIYEGSDPYGVQRADYFFGNFTNRSQNSSSGWFSLKSITYPTGGSTQYFYEPNRFIDATTGQLTYGGGQRVSKIQSNDLINGNTLIRSYIYGQNGDGYGQEVLDVNYNMFVNEYMHFNLDPLFQDPIPNRAVTYSTAMLGDIEGSGFLSNFVLYPEVTEVYSEYGSQQTNGKITYKYELNPQFQVNGFLSHDQYFGSCGLNFQYRNGPLYVQQFEGWNKPLLTEEDYYSSSNNLIKKTLYNYTVKGEGSYTGLKVRPYAFTDDAYPNPAQSYYDEVASFFKYGLYTVTSGINLLTSKQDIMYGLDGESVTEEADYNYNAFNQVAKITKTMSGGTLEDQEFSYPDDFPDLNSANDDDKGVLLLQQMNKVNAVIEVRDYKMNQDGSNKRLTAATYTQYGASQPLPLNVYLTGNTSSLTDFSPIQVENGVLIKDENYYKLRSVFSYDSYGDLLQEQRDERTRSYIWDYHHTYPIAEVMDAGRSDIAYTSFEADGDGNWSIPSGGVTTAYAITGSSCYNLSIAGAIGITKSGLNSSSTYVVSYWTRNGSSYSISGTQGLVIKGKTINGWTYYEHHVTGVSSVTISGSGYIDELRLYPVDALMTTYTYKPLTGMTSTCGADNSIQYYEYDGFGRLIRKKNEDGMILKQYDYQYQAPIYQ